MYQCLLDNLFPLPFASLYFSLRTGLETANMTIDKLRIELLEAKKEPVKAIEQILDGANHTDFELNQARLTEVKSTYEDAKRTISQLEDHLAEVRFQLKQKNAETTSLQSVLKAREESYQSEVTELRSKSDYLRLELVNLTRKVDKLSEEKNGYRAQVQDMNMALKNRLVLLSACPMGCKQKMIPTDWYPKQFLRYFDRI